MKSTPEQSPENPLFPEVIWSRPENKRQGGNLLIVGGNEHSITAPNTAYSIAKKGIVNDLKVVLPSSTKKYFPQGTVPPETLFAPSTLSGSFGIKAKPELQSFLAWADAVVICGDISKNSETTMLFTELVDISTTITAITDDALEACYSHIETLLQHGNLIFVATFSQLQKITNLAHARTAITSTMSRHSFIEALREFSHETTCHIVAEFQDSLYVAYTGQVIVSHAPHIDKKLWAIHVATLSATWAMQQPQHATKAIATSLLFYQ